MSPSRATVAATVLLAGLAAACSMFEPALAKQIRRDNSFRLVAEDDRCLVWSVRSLSRDEGREWLRLVATERKRVEDFFATTVAGKISLWLVDELPKGFQGDAFAEGTDIYLRMGRALRPSLSEETLVAHEMTHVVLEKAFGMPRPFWFEEGLATYIEGQRVGFGMGRRDMLSGVGGLDRIDVAALTLENVDQVERPLAYRLSAAAIELILEKHGYAAIRRLQREPSGRRLGDAYFRVTGERLESLEARWRDEIRTSARLQAVR